MATYTDLHNKIKETITVDYKDRVTTQEVKFKNGKNEYWGTLKGGIVAEDIDVKKGTLEGVTIKNSIVEGSFDLPGGVNLAKVGTDIALLSDDLIETKEWLKSVDDDLGNEKVVRASMDTALSIAIDNAITATNAVDKLLKEQFEAADKQIRDDFTLSCNDLTDKILSVRSDLGYETFIRSKQDEQLSNLISNVEKESIIRDTDLSNSLHEHAEQAKKELAETKSTLLSAIEKDRHYVINFENTYAYPFNSKDFAVNIYDTKIVDGNVVYTDVMGKQHNIGSIIKEKNGSITFKSFAEYTTKDLTEALPTNTTLNFEELPSTKLLEGSNYRFHIDADNPQDISTIRIWLEPLRTQYRQLLCEGEPIGKVLSANPDDVTLPLESGVLYVDASTDELDVFNKFKNVEFNDTDLSVLTKVDENPTERITYLGNNEFKFEKNIRKYDYISLFDDTLENSKKHFGKIYKNRGISGVIYNEDGEVEQINVTLNNNVYSLDAKNNFTANVVETDDYIDQLSASVNGTEAKISYTKISEKYSYDFSGFNEDGDVIASGKVIPVQYNKTLAESRNFETVSVDLTNVMRIEAFRKNYLLHRINKDEEKWSTSVTDDNGKNTLDIVFNVVNVLIKVTSKTTGEILRLIFNVKNDEPVVANPEEAYINIGIDNSVDLTDFSNSVEDGKEYAVYIEPHTTNSNEKPIENINVDTSSSGTLKIKIPTRKIEEISHEFMVVIKPTCYSNKELVELEFVDELGQHVKIINNRHEKLLVPTNKWSTIQLNEINYGVFFVKDMDEGEHGFEYNKLRNDVDIITGDVNNHKLSADQKFTEIDANIEYLSDEISTKWEATCLSADNICIELSNEIDRAVAYEKYLSDEINLSANNLCIALSNEIDRAVLKENNLCLEVSNLSNQVSNISSYLSDEITSNDADIKYLSDEISGNMLCTELSVSNLDGRINELSTHHADHYDKTFVETTSENGPDKTFDSLKIIDCDNTKDKYKLIFKDGTLVLEKLS